MSPSERAAIVLAAGQGTRMKSDLAKVLHPIAGRPMIGHVLAALDQAGIDRVVVVIGPGMDDVAGAVAPHRTAIQDRPLGTGDAVRAARRALAGFDGDVLVLFGDTPLLTADTIAAMAAARRASGAAVVVLGFRPDDPAQYGRLVTDEGGALEAIVEHAEATPAQRAIGVCNAGIMAIDGRHLFSLLDRITNDNTKGEFYLTDIVAIARAEGLGCAVHEAGSAEEVMGINARAELAVAEGAMQRRLRAAAMAGGATLIDPGTVYLSADTVLGRDVTIGPQVFFGPGVRVADRVEIRAFCHIEQATIASGAVIGPFARLRPGADIGSGAHIGNFVEIKAAVVEDGAKINHLSYIGDARIGAGANVGAGTITCNYDGFFKSHTDIGAGAFIGSNTALVAPVRIGDGAIVGAGSVITIDVPDGALGVSRAQQMQRAGWAVTYRTKKQAEKDAARRKKAS
jgi:bifunctional UDP-N-acetylglucosamine pyrophosphorylase / glucosamine-1-phosphate N-acetyltransferase